ncbi:MAG: carboxymuconolactone decarboxylase family protein [Acidobacteriota bacterium]|jgi:AhpD family alkylhydroperoxidase
MTERLEQFRRFREKMNKRILDQGHKGIQRFFAIDGQAYMEGVLPRKTKEMLGLASSMVLRCDDCIAYHLVRCKEEGCTRDELMEVFNVGLVVGGSIVIPHLRRAVALLDELEGVSSGEDT